MPTPRSGPSCSGAGNCGHGGPTTRHSCSRGCLRPSRGPNWVVRTPGPPDHAALRPQGPRLPGRHRGSGTRRGHVPRRELWRREHRPLGAPHWRCSHHGPRDRSQPWPQPRPQRLLRGGHGGAGRLRHGSGYRATISESVQRLQPPPTARLFPKGGRRVPLQRAGFRPPGAAGALRERLCGRGRGVRLRHWPGVPGLLLPGPQLFATCGGPVHPRGLLRILPAEAGGRAVPPGCGRL